MRRITLLVGGAMALSALSLVPVLLGEATAAGKPPSTAPAAGTAKPNMGPATVPEDGGGAEDFPASSRLVRDVLKARPTEDLIICVAGCRPGNDRVVYAQPSDPREPAASPVQVPQPLAEQGPENEPPESAVSEVPASGMDGSAAEESAAEKAAAEDAAGRAGEAEAEAQASGDAAEEGRMEPTAAEPEAPSEPASEQPFEDAPSESAGEPEAEAMPESESASDDPSAE